ncbi:hypothetical protein [Endozoicomonas lisbonensis]|uniref:Uncharacterized protein n=1 Tax=Endozoicomonas lisbonensis TaxID=3120522 RepID=A0ABV2SKH6_9GAMM
MSAFLRFVVSIVFLIGLAEAGEFRIDVYNATGFFSQYFTEDGQVYEDSQILAMFQQLPFIRSIHVNHDPNRYFIYSDYQVQRNPEIPAMANPELRRETLKSASVPSKRLRNKRLPDFLISNSDTNPIPRNIEISRSDNQSFSVKSTWSNGKTSHRKMTGNPLSMINVLIDVEDCMGRRDVRFSRTQKQWQIKTDDARVVPGLSISLRYTREQWDQTFYDGILGVDEGWSIYAIVMSSGQSILWNGRMVSHQVVIGFQLVNQQSHSNLFIQMTNWTNDDLHCSYNYLNPETSSTCPLLSESENKVDGSSEFILYSILIHAGAGTSNEETDPLPLRAYINKGFRDDDDDDAPAASGAAGCRGCMISSDR